MHFRNYRRPKAWLEQCLKSPVLNLFLYSSNLYQFWKILKKIDDHPSLCTSQNTDCERSG